MDITKTPGANAEDATAPWRVPNNICTIAILKTFLTKEEIILAHAGKCCLLLPRNKVDTRDPSDFF